MCPLLSIYSYSFMCVHSCLYTATHLHASITVYIQLLIYIRPPMSIYSYSFICYESRLLQCGLTTLETRRLRGDQIEVFKIVNGYEDVDRNMFFKLKEGSRTKGHKAELVKGQCRLDMRKYSFSQRVINEWNRRPNDCVNASSVNMFKNRIDRYLIWVGYT